MRKGKAGDNSKRRRRRARHAFEHMHERSSHYPRQRAARNSGRNAGTRGGRRGGADWRRREGCGGRRQGRGERGDFLRRMFLLQTRLGEQLHGQGRRLGAGVQDRRNAGAVCARAARGYGSYKNSRRRDRQAGSLCRRHSRHGLLGGGHIGNRGRRQRACSGRRTYGRVLCALRGYYGRKCGFMRKK